MSFAIRTVDTNLSALCLNFHEYFVVVLVVVVKDEIINMWTEFPKESNP